MAIDHERLEQLEERANSANGALHVFKSRYLESCGWKYTCDTPGCAWMWEGPLPDGRRVLVNGLDKAWAMQEFAEQHAAMTPNAIAQGRGD